MSDEPVPGMVLGTFDTTIPDDFTTRLDAVLGAGDARADRPTVPPGAFVFFSFLPDMSWMEKTGVAFDRSLAIRRKLRVHDDVRTGDRLVGRSVVAEVNSDRRGKARRFVTIATDYQRDGHLVLEEAVTYLTVLETLTVPETE